MRVHRLLLAAASTLCLVTATACGTSAATSSSSASASAAKDPDTIVLAAVPSEQSQSLSQQYSVLIKVLEKETGKKVEFQNATDYAAVIEGQRAGKIHIAGYGPFSYVKGHDGGVPIVPVGSMVAKGAQPGYKSYGIVPGKSEINDLSGFKGKKVCFVDENSTSGYLYPTAGLKQNNIDPAKDITPVMAGGHDASALSVKDGKCDAGFAFDDMVDKTLPSKGQIKDGDLKIVWKSDTIAGSPHAMLTTLSPDLQSKIRKAFEETNVDWLSTNGFCDSNDPKKCQLPEGKWGFVKVEDNLYDGVRNVCKVTQAKACK